MNSRIILILFCLIACCSCSKRQKNNPVRSKADSALIMNENEDFYAFIEEFHKDSIFALSRMEDKIYGGNTDDYEYDTLGNVHNTERIWTKNELGEHLCLAKELRHNKKKYKTDYYLNSDSARERIYLPESGFMLIFIFRQTEHKWNLKEYYYNNF